MRTAPTMTRGRALWTSVALKSLSSTGRSTPSTRMQWTSSNLFPPQLYLANHSQQLPELALHISLRQALKFWSKRSACAGSWVLIKTVWERPPQSLELVWNWENMVWIYIWSEQSAFAARGCWHKHSGHGIWHYFGPSKVLALPLKLWGEIQA